MIHPHASAQWRSLDQLWSASRADDVTSRDACQGLLYTPPHAKTVPQSETHRNVEHKEENSCFCSVSFIYILFLKQFFSHNTTFSFAILYFCLQKAHNSFSIFSSSFAKLYFLLQYFKSLANICGIVLTPYKGRIQFTCHRGLFTNISQWCLTENTVLKIKWVSFFYYCHFAPGLCVRLRFVHRLMHSGVSALFFTVLSIFVKEFSCLFLKLVSQLTIANSEKPGLIYGVVWDRL